MFVEGAGCYISSDASLGARLHFPHPVGIVIGEGVKVGNGCTIYQCTTLGRNKLTDKSYPTVGDDVVLYAGAVVIGEVKLGNGSVVGANSVVLSDVPAGSAAVGSPARIIAVDEPPKRKPSVGS
ncbi:serine O-acetyltransferase [Bradyrhizobium yuanmingense]|uniref:serine O-acetyltransferase n=1 Tax=Bradyrhizobium yuanmingense TaxID=108015 RepID=UPI00351938F2